MRSSLDLTQPLESPVDIIVAWPDSCDYPLWRVFIQTHRDYFKDIFVVFTKTNQGHDYREFIKKQMNDKHELNITFLDTPPIKPTDDWRNLAVNLALEKSTGNWVWFTEQDLFVTHQAFWPMMAKYMFNYDAVVYKEGNVRVHPSNMWVKRSFIDKTSKDFGIVKDKYDHFHKFYTALRLTDAKVKTIPYPNANFYHMNGLSHNMSLLERGEVITYEPEEFLGYLQMVVLDGELDPHFSEVVSKGIKQLQEQLK